MVFYDIFIAFHGILLHSIMFYCVLSPFIAFLWRLISFYGVFSSFVPDIASFIFVLSQ